MNGSKSPLAPSDPVDTAPKQETDTVAAPAQSIEGRDGQARDTAPNGAETDHPGVDGDDDGAESEAETLIESPVKKREAEKAAAAVKTEKPAKSRIGSLPVPGDDDEDSDAPGSPVESTEPPENGKKSNRELRNDRMQLDGHSENEDSDSGSLSSAHSSVSNGNSRTSSRSRAFSESRESLNASTSPNPRKRKHRASSVGLPNKRQSLEPPKRKLRGLKSDENSKDNDDSNSSQARGHKRTVSTQSAFADMAESNGRSRRGQSQRPVRDPKKSNWEESDGSSETTSHGQNESRRPQRGVGRSTSTPGRPAGREHKRHINKYGFTRLAEACEDGDLDLVKEWREKDPEQLELAEFAGNTPLQIAALNGNDDVVTYLINEGCKVDCANLDMDTPLIDASENGHIDVVRILLKAGVDPTRQNIKGQQAMDVVSDDTDDAEAIRVALREAIETWTSDDAKQRREVEEEQRHKGSTNDKLHFMARTYENLLKLVTINDRGSVKEFLDARVPVDNTIIAAAAKTGDSYLVNMLLAEMTQKKAFQKAEKPMHAVLGTSHFNMVEALTELDQFNPLYKSKAGKSWPELAEERNGPNSRREKELLQKLYDQAIAKKMRRSSSPVTKREKGKRRPNYRAESEESEEGEEEVPKRKNGRRLMSRRDMRVANGKGHSDTDLDESHSDMDTTADGNSDQEMKSMGPPESPSQSRTGIAGRTRRKSLSMQSVDNSPKLRRRSSSVRGAAEEPLPATARSTEKKATDDVGMSDKKDEAAKKREEDEKKRAQAENEEAEKAALAQTRRRDEAAAEEARSVEQERAANAARIKNEEAEKARKAEEDRKAEEEQCRRVAELEEARKRIRDEVLESLTASLNYVLNPASTFSYKSEHSKSYLLDRFTPLLVVKESLSKPEADDTESWVLTAQAAPLLGKQGLDILLPTNSDVAFDQKVCSDWLTYSEFSPAEAKNVEAVVTVLTAGSNEDGEDEEMVDDESFETELQQMAERYNSAIDMKKKLEAGPAALHCVKLADVLRNLDPLLKDTMIEVRSLGNHNSQDMVKSLNQSGIETFIECFASRFWKQSLLSKSYPTPPHGSDGRETDSGVVVRYEK
ncbi:Hypothetical protein R9X50_00121300 [Acrodontium crateriforme]|uniref:Uncharacterized protein n=1 Tax=Acrodontium crateriforme TaxID=150365 RepID=A0AAQ3R5M0_9PEZI|nr:Hypothetical protein R9X50_00121300 [Acrodontium crateriforme]